jgi:hypothetical protein
MEHLDLFRLDKDDPIKRAISKLDLEIQVSDNLMETLNKNKEEIKKYVNYYIDIFGGTLLNNIVKAFISKEEYNNLFKLLCLYKDFGIDDIQFRVSEYYLTFNIIFEKVNKEYIIKFVKACNSPSLLFSLFLNAVKYKEDEIINLIISKDKDIECINRDFLKLYAKYLQMSKKDNRYLNDIYDKITNNFAKLDDKCKMIIIEFIIFINLEEGKLEFDKLSTRLINIYCDNILENMYDVKSFTMNQILIDNYFVIVEKFYNKYGLNDLYKRIIDNINKLKINKYKYDVSIVNKKIMENLQNNNNYYYLRSIITNIDYEDMDFNIIDEEFDFKEVIKFLDRYVSHDYKESIYGGLINHLEFAERGIKNTPMKKSEIMRLENIINNLKNSLENTNNIDDMLDLQNSIKRAELKKKFIKEELEMAEYSKSKYGGLEKIQERIKVYKNELNKL